MATKNAKSEGNHTVVNGEQRIKIICTLGPSSMSDKVLKRMDELGVSLLRLNMSHTSIEDLEGSIRAVRGVTQVPVCIDTEGAQIRTGRLAKGDVELQRGAQVTLLSRDADGDESAFTLKPPEAFQGLEPGTLLSVDLNAVLLLVLDCDEESARARVLNGGTVGSNKAVTADRNIWLPPLTLKDKQAVGIAMGQGVDQYALSFASHQASVLAMREEVGPSATVISKIETRAALENLDGIIGVSDAVLIDRGDLSRDVPVEHLPFLQKRIIARAHETPIPAYVATNLMESMVSAPYPSRAEVSDVATTLLDGADGLVLAAETAIGRYPVNCVSMVRRLIMHHLSETRASGGLSGVWQGNGMLSASNPPHGGKLTERRMSRDHSIEEFAGYPKLVVDVATVRDAQQIALGTYSPLKGFMGRDDINCVLDSYALGDGTVWTLPIVLQVESQAVPCVVGDDLVLVCSCCSKPAALMKVGDVYQFDPDSVFRRWFGSSDETHPGVASLMKRGDCFLGGDITLLRQHHYGSLEYSLSPTQVRAIFAHYGWEKVVGFHTRNAPHMAHEFIQMEALERVGGDGLLIHPVLGQKKAGDFSQEAILAGYETLIDARYPKDRVLLTGFYGNSWYAGPREAVFTAICRKNYGCTHFVVGRDHTGVSGFYEPSGVVALFEKLGDIGIEPVFFDEVLFDPKENRYQEVPVGTDRGGLMGISGTVMREYISAGEAPPEWMMRPEVSERLLQIRSEGGRVFES